MPVSIERTPNPNAIKFSVGCPVGGPVTYTSPDAADAPVVAAIFAAGGVRQVFMTADFISVTKTDDTSWDDLMPAVRDAIAEAYA